MSSFKVDPNFSCESPYGGYFTMFYTPEDVLALIHSLERQITLVREEYNKSFDNENKRSSIQRTLDILTFIKFMAIKELKLMKKLGEKYNEK